MTTTLKKNLNRVEKGYISDIKYILKDLKANYIITTTSGKDVTLTELIQLYLPQEKEQSYQCSAILNNGNRCSHKSLKETDHLYCKKHMFKFHKTYSHSKQLETNESDNYDLTTLNDLTNESDNYDLIHDTTLMKQQFIDDTLYYHDDKFIYKNTNDSFNKCGYIELKEEQYTFHLINDPFLLNQL